VLVCYLDDSGKDKANPITTVAGFVADETDWERFESLVEPHFANASVKVLHAMDMHHTEGEFGAFPVIVTNGADVSGMTLRTSLGTTITGRVLYESTTGEMPSPAATSLSAVPADFDLAPPGLAVAEPDADGAFQLRGITGLRRLQATKVPKGWMLTSIVMNGHDVTDELLDFGQPNQGEVSVDVVLSTRVNELAGRVLDERGRGVVDARVVSAASSASAERLTKSPKR